MLDFLRVDRRDRKEFAVTVRSSPFANGAVHYSARIGALNTQNNRFFSTVDPLPQRKSLLC